MVCLEAAFAHRFRHCHKIHVYRSQTSILRSDIARLLPVLNNALRLCCLLFTVCCLLASGNKLENSVAKIIPKISARTNNVIETPQAALELTFVPGIGQPFGPQPQAVKRQNADHAAKYEQRRMFGGREEYSQVVLDSVSWPRIG